MKRRLTNNQGFTLIEVVLVAGILAFTITSMIQLYIYTSVQAEMAGNKTLAVSAAQNKLEEIRDHDYSSILTDYVGGGTPGDTFTLSYLNGRGKIYIDNSASFISSTSADLLGIMVVVSWRNKYNRVVGEDTDLDGVLDAGEDTNGNGRLDSPVTLMSMITLR